MSALKTSSATTEEAQRKPHLLGLIVVDAANKVLAAFGKGKDPRLCTLATDTDWMASAHRRCLAPFRLTDGELIGMTADFDGGTLIAFSEPSSETVMRFFLSVDFAHDILHHILTDPFEALNIVDGDGNIVFLSPTHEKFLGFEEGGSEGQPARDVIPNTRLHQVVRTGIAEVGQIQRFKGYERVVSRHPMRHDGAIGRIMFKGPEQVEALSRRINVLEQEIATYRLESAAQRKSDQVEDEPIHSAMALFNGNKKRVAENLGISRSYLYKKLGSSSPAETLTDAVAFTQCRR